VRTTAPFESTIWTVTRSALRSRNPIGADAVLQPQTGEMTLRGTWVLVIGLCWSFSPSVTANAAAVPPSRPTTSRVERSRATSRAGFYGESSERISTNGSASSQPTDEP
jgi:hypothetical protein